MTQEALTQTANTFTLWGDHVLSGVTFDPGDVVGLLKQMKTAVRSDTLPLPLYPDQIGDHLRKALAGDLHAAREFAETLNGYVTIAIREEENGDSSVMIVDDATDMTTLRRAPDECDAFVTASLHHMGARIDKLTNAPEPASDQDEPEM